MDTNRTLKLAVLVFVFSLAIRVTWVALAHVTPISDFKGYDELAMRWLTTGQFGEAGSYAYRTPGYPGFLALVYTVVGHSPRVAGFVQALLGALTSGLLVLLAAHVLSPRASVIAGLLHAVSPPALAYVPVLASETLAAFLLISGLLCLAAAEAREGNRRFNLMAGSGALFGLMVLVRPAAAFFVPAGLLLSVYSPRKREWHSMRGLVFLAAVMLALSPWVIRNRRLGLGSFAISTVGGENLWMGNNDKARLGGFCAEAWWPPRPAEGERERDSRYRRAARNWILSHPGRYLTLSLIRAYRFFSTEPDTWAAKYLWPTRANDLAFVTTDRYEPIGLDRAPPELLQRALDVEMHHAIMLKRVRMVVAPLVLIALVVALPWWRDYAIVLLPVFFYLGGLSLTYTEIRFRELTDPLLFIPLSGFLSMFIFRSTELASEPLRPSQALAVVISAVKTFTPDFQQKKGPSPSPISRAAADETLRARRQETAGYLFTGVDLAQPGTQPVVLWNYPTWLVAVSRHEEGIRCRVRASSQLSADQHGGIVFSAQDFKALRLELGFTNPRHIRAVHVDGCDSEGSPRVRWRWEVFSDNLPPIQRQTYLLVPGQPSWYFVPEGEGEPERVTQVRLYLQVAANAKAGFILHRAELSTGADSETAPTPSQLPDAS